MACNGRECGLGTHLSGGRYVCPHNNLAVQRPNLALEWDYERNNFNPTNITINSGKYVWWKCSINPCGCHKWMTKICNRTGKNKTGCPYCSGHNVCLHSSLYTLCPNISREWDYENNGELKPWEISPNSSIQYSWLCIDPKNWCGCHKWKATANNRVSNGTGCPYCVGRNTCIHSSLAILFPIISSEWNYKLNNITPENIAPYSNIEYWWTCRNNICGCHVWKCSVANRTSKQSDCPYCCNQKVCLHSSIQTLYPDLILEWDHIRNKYKPYEITPGSDTICWWICKNNFNHKWKSRVVNRTSLKRGCPHCSSSRQYSKAQIEWLQELEISLNIKIQHALSDDGEFKIPGIGKVDGYCNETNTIYEYHGNYYHGNPNMFHPEDTNEKIGKTFGELYQKTLERDNKIISFGYNLVVKWETSIEILHNKDEIIELVIDPKYFKIYNYLT